MNSIRLFRDNNGKGHTGAERRRKPRIRYPIPIKVRGIGQGGEHFEFETVANDLSASGFSANATHELTRGQCLFLLIQFSLAKHKTRQAPTIAAYGTVLRTEKEQSGCCKFAAELKLYRFL